MSHWISVDDARAAISSGRGEGIKVAVLDSGINAQHPALNGLQLSDDVAIVADGDRLRVANGEEQDIFGHGTAVASIVRSVAPDAEIGSFRVLGESLGARTAIISEGARLAMERGYHVLNCSLGCAIPNHVLLYKSWVDEAYLRGIHVVAACNNHDPSRPEWPGFFTSVLTVNMGDNPSDKRLFYRRGHLVEFATDGVDVEVPWLKTAMKRVTGSSFAAPRLAGMLACLLSQVPSLTPVQAKALLHQIATPWTERTDSTSLAHGEEPSELS